MLCNSNLDEVNGKKTFTIKYHEDKKDEDQKKKMVSFFVQQHT